MLSLPVPAWPQASLPVKNGGLGIRSAAQLAPSAFLASLLAPPPWLPRLSPDTCKSSHLLPGRWHLSAGHKDTTALHTRLSISPPERMGCPKGSGFQALLENAPDARSCAHLLVASRKESGAWLNALTVSSLGLRMDDKTTRVAVGLRLGTPLCHLHECSNCRTMVDNLANHGFSCR